VRIFHRLVPDHGPDHPQTRGKIVQVQASAGWDSRRECGTLQDQEYVFAPFAPYGKLYQIGKAGGRLFERPSSRSRARSKTWAWLPAGARACFSSLIPGQNPGHPPTLMKIRRLRRAGSLRLRRGRAGSSGRRTKRTEFKELRSLRRTIIIKISLDSLTP
jgi:hypothetical protein